MPDPFAVQISELVKSGRVSSAMANALTEHYSKQYDQLKKEMGGAPPLVNLMDLMNLIDLLEKKAGVQKAPGLPPNPSSQQMPSPGPVAAPVPAGPEKSPVDPEALRVKSEKEKLEVHNEALKRRCEALEAELAVEKRVPKESSTDEFAYAKRFAEAEAERRQARILEEEKRKALEEENRRLTEEIQRMRDGEEAAGKRNGEVRAVSDVSSVQIQSLERRCAEYQAEIACLEKVRGETETALREGERVRAEIASEKERLEGERLCLGKDLEARAAEEVRLKAILQEAEEMAEKLNARILGLVGDKQIAQKENEEKAAAIRVWENDKKRVEDEKQRLEGEREGLKSKFAKTAEEVTGLNVRIKELEDERQRSALEKKIPGEAWARLEGEKLQLEKALEGRITDLANLERVRECLAKGLERSEAEKNKAVARVLELEKDAARTASQTEGFEKRFTELENEIRQLTVPGNEQGHTSEGLAEKIREMGILWKKKANAQAALEEELKREKEMRAKDQARTRYMEETLTALEKKVDALISPPGV